MSSEHEKDLNFIKGRNRVFTVLLGALAVIFLTLLIINEVNESKAKREAKKSLESTVTGEAAAELCKDNTKSIRIAEAAYGINKPFLLERTSQVLAEAGYSSQKKPFYITSIKHNPLTVG
jgi:hypothetical protein